MNAESHQSGVVLVTAGSQEEAKAIASTLVESNLAACVNLFPVHSVYTWQGEVNAEQEWQLFVKTDLAHYDALETKLKQIHAYDEPEIIALPIVAGSQSYLQWISQQVQPSQ